MDWVKKKMYQARLQRNGLQEDVHIGHPDDRMEGNEAIPALRRSRFLPLSQRLSWLAGGMVLGVVVVSMVWRADPIGAGNEVAGNALEQHRQPVLLPMPSNANIMKEELHSLTEQVQILTTTVADLQTRLLEIHTVTSSIASAGKGLGSDGYQKQLVNSTDAVAELEVLPPPAAGFGDPKMSEGRETAKSGDVLDTTHMAPMEQPSADNVKQPQETSKQSGPWVINLVSLPHKADAERFVEKAESRGVDAELYQVTVKGKTYWRVHVTDFATAAEAKSNANVIKGKLGLNDVWVAKR